MAKNDDNVKKTKEIEQPTPEKKQKSFFDSLGDKKVSPNQGLEAPKKKKIVVFKNIKDHKEGEITQAFDEGEFNPNRTNTKIKGKITLPNKLTIFRLFLVIPFIVCLTIPLCMKPILDDFGSTMTIVPSYTFKVDWRLIPYIIAGAIFIIAMITDYLDGHIARKRNIVSTFGQIFDPIADKVITTIALIFLSLYGILPFWITAIIVVRDLIVDGLRILSASKGEVVPASKYGKLKTIFTTLGITILLFSAPSWNYWTITNVFFSPTFPTIFGVSGMLTQYTHNFDNSMNLFWCLNFILMIPMFLATIFSVISGIGYYRAVRKHIEIRSLE